MLRMVLAAAAALAAGAAQAQQSYPIVFGDKALLRELGVTLKDVGPQPDVPAFADKCHYYGDGGDALSLAPEFVAMYRDKGFSVASLCLGMLSGIRFHPETGVRLATFLVADLEMIASADPEMMALYGPDPMAMSRELPLEIPDCFSGGRPLADCELRHDPETGASLSEPARQSLAALAAQADTVGGDAVASGRFARSCAPGEAPDAGCRIDLYPDTPDYIYIKGRRAREIYAGSVGWPVTFFDISDEFPAGFGYALFADGAAGPSASLGAEKIALDPKRRASRAVIEGLKIKLE